jgi:hypothetical protein
MVPDHTGAARDNRQGGPRPSSVGGGARVHRAGARGGEPIEHHAVSGRTGPAAGNACGSRRAGYFTVTASLRRLHTFAGMVLLSSLVACSDPVAPESLPQGRWVQVFDSPWEAGYPPFQLELRGLRAHLTWGPDHAYSSRVEVLEDGAFTFRQGDQRLFWGRWDGDDEIEASYEWDDWAIFLTLRPDE